MQYRTQTTRKLRAVISSAFNISVHTIANGMMPVEHLTEIKKAVFWDMMQCGFARTDFSEERIAFIITLKIVSELGTMLAVTSNRKTQGSSEARTRADEGGSARLKA
jgi:hypothetical protein